MIKTFELARDIKENPSEITELNTYAGSLFSGAIVGTINDANIKKFNHWTSASATGSYYQSIYNTHVTASTAIELATITFGYSISSSFYGAANETNKTEKNRIYKLYAKQLLGNENGRFSISGTIRDELVFLSFTRSQRKDELRKETLTMKSFNSGASGGPTPAITATQEYTWSDTGAASSYTKGLRGDYADLISGSLVAGQVYYQAGTLVLIPENFSNTSSVTTDPGNTWSGSFDYGAMALSGGGGTLDNTIDAMRYRIRNLSLINTTILHSTLYFCRALNDEFNYSSNPTFIDSSNRIITTSGSNNLTSRTYITKVGLVGENNELLAVASISEPLKKTPENERTIIVRLDY